MSTLNIIQTYNDYNTASTETSLKIPNLSPASYEVLKTIITNAGVSYNFEKTGENHAIIISPKDIQTVSKAIVANNLDKAVVILSPEGTVFGATTEGQKQYDAMTPTTKAAYAEATAESTLQQNITYARPTIGAMLAKAAKSDGNPDLSTEEIKAVIKTDEFKKLAAVLGITKLHAEQGSGLAKDPDAIGNDRVIVDIVIPISGGTRTVTGSARIDIPLDTTLSSPITPAGPTQSTPSLREK